MVVTLLSHNLLFTLIFLLCKISANRRSYQIPSSYSESPSAFGLGPSSAALASLEVGFAEEVIYYIACWLMLHRSAHCSGKSCILLSMTVLAHDPDDGICMGAKSSCVTL